MACYKKTNLTGSTEDLLTINEMRKGLKQKEIHIEQDATPHEIEELYDAIFPLRVMLPINVLPMKLDSLLFLLMRSLSQQ